jgi:hypothetical protein
MDFIFDEVKKPFDFSLGGFQCIGRPYSARYTAYSVLACAFSSAVDSG